ncbi:MAG: hypothetical protein ACT4OU_06675 [Hyphomicrobium sp.]
MDLEAANLANARAGRLSRLGMLACFAVAGGLLVASLALADSHAAAPSLSTSLPTHD